MFNLFNRLNNEKGFTLVELMVVVVIIGILVAIIIPIYGNVQDNAAMKSHEANLRTIDGAISMYIAEEGGNPTSIKSLIDAGFLSEEPRIPDRILSAEDKTKFLEEVDSIGDEGTYTIEVSSKTVPEGKGKEYGELKAFPAPTSGWKKDAYRKGDTPFSSGS